MLYRFLLHAYCSSVYDLQIFVSKLNLWVGTLLLKVPALNMLYDKGCPKVIVAIGSFIVTLCQVND